MNIIRQVEKNILDQEYRKFNLIYRPEDLAIDHLFKVFGDFWRDLINDQTLGTYAKRRQMLNTACKALGHCFRWLANEPVHKILLPGDYWKEIDIEAIKLLNWGISYEILCIDHVAWSRGILEVRLDRTEKTITFSYPPNFDSFFLLTQLTSEHKANAHYFQSIPFDDISGDFKQWLAKVKFDGQGFHIPASLVRQTKAYSAVMDWLKTVIWPELEGDKNLDGYTLDDFRQLYAALFINCQYCTQVENDFDTRFGLENEMGSRSLCLPEADMVTWLSEMSGIEPISVGTMLEDLTFDTTNFHANLTNQPFVKSKSGEVHALPRLIANTNPSRMLSGALNKSKKRKVYEGIVQSLEQSNLDIIVSRFKELKLSVIREKSLINKNGQKITPDLIVFDKQNQELLVIDYKHTLNPLGPSEVIYKLDEVRKGLKQVRKYLNFVRENLQLLDELVDDLGPSIKIYALLLFRWSMPIPISTDPEVIMIDWFSLSGKLSKEDFTCLSDLVNWARKRPDVSTASKLFEITSFEIQVADWKYKSAILASNESGFLEE